MKVGQRRPRLKDDDIYALVNKDVSERGALVRLNRGDKTTVTYTHRPSLQKTAVNAVHADATADPNTAEPTDTSVNAVGYPRPPANTTANPGCKPPPSNQPVWVQCSKHWKQRQQTDMDYRIDLGVTNTPFGCVNLIPLAVAPIWHFGGSLTVVNLRVVVAIRVVVTVRVVVGIRVVVATRAIQGERERCTGADVGRSVQRSPL